MFRLIIAVGIEGVANVRATAPILLEWTQLPNSAKPDCITGYIVSWGVGQGEISGPGTSVNVTSLAGFPYFQTISVTITPNTPLGAATKGASSSTVMFQHPGVC